MVIGETEEMVLAVAGIIVLFLIVVLAFVGGHYLWNKNITCPRFAENIERPYKFDYFAGGCFVQTAHGQWVLDKNYWNNVTPMR